MGHKLIVSLSDADTFGNVQFQLNGSTEFLKAFGPLEGKFRTEEELL
jgi:hypothetical protein